MLLAAISALSGASRVRAMAAGALASGGSQCSRAESSQLGREGKGSAVRAASAVLRRLRRAVLRCVVPEAPGIVPVPSSVHAVVTCVQEVLLYGQVPTAICPSPSVRRPRHNRTADTLCERQYRNPGRTGRRSSRAAWDARTHARLHARRRYADETAKVKGDPPRRSCSSPLLLFAFSQQSRFVSRSCEQSTSAS